MTRGAGVWRNWGRTEAIVPARVERPHDAGDVVDLIERARRDDLPVKAVGSGHSFNGVAVAPGVQVDLGRMSGLVGVDAATGRATFRAGTPLHRIPDLLEPHGLALQNLGDIDRQTLAGATSTGTHGTGARFGGLATQITAATLVTGTAEVVTVDTPELLQCVAVGLGALGVLTELTVQCVPRFSLRAVDRPARIEAVTESFAHDIAAHDHYEFYWFPHTDVALTRTNTRLPADSDACGPGAARRWVDDELLANGVFRGLCAAGARWPAVVPHTSRLAAGALSARTVVDRSDRVFVSHRRVAFREMEYAVPVSHIPDVVAGVRSLIARRGYRVSFPIEVRAAAADDLALSTASGRASGYVAVHRYHRDAPDAYFDDVAALMAEHDGRPHWGKMHALRADRLRRLYPRFEQFLAVRDRFDPDRVFANRYTDSVLGA